MSGAKALQRPDRPTFPSPHLSHAQIAKYLHCPESYRLYYVERLRPRVPAANLVFGQVVHQSLAEFFRNGVDPRWYFVEEWKEMRELGLRFGPRESWEKLDQVGGALLEKFLEEEVPRIGKVQAVEAPFELDLSTLDTPFVGIIDLVADFDGKRTVIDFKTSASHVEAHEAQLSDQLTAYQLAEPEATQAAFCVLVKTKEPKIEWHVTTRSAEQVRDYLAKVGLVAREIQGARFYKRPGKWCSWCEFLPVCLGDAAQIEKTLVKTA